MPKRYWRKRIKSFGNKSSVAVNAPRRIQVAYSVSADSNWGLKIDLDCIHDTDDDAYKDIILRNKMYVISRRVDEEHSVSYKITKQEAFDFLDRRAINVFGEVYY